MTPKEPMVFIVDDDEDSRLFIITHVKSVGINVLSFSHPLDFLSNYEPDWTGCLISDIRMPEIGGLDFQKRLLSMDNHLPIIFLTAYGDIPSAVEAMKMGAFDFLEKPIRLQVLIDRVQQAINFDLESCQKRAIDQDIYQRFQALTDREKEVLKWIVEGDANKVIAIKLSLSQKTVEFHRANVMKKMKAKSLAELVQMCGRLVQPRVNTRAIQGLHSFSDYSKESMHSL